MGITENIKSLASQLQQGAKNSTVSLSQKILRLISAVFISLFISLVIQEMMQSGTLTLVFFSILFTSLIYMSLGRLSLFQILIFDLICVLIVSLMRLYIMLAP